MTIDERLQFLLHSTESLHGTVNDMAGQVHELTGQVQGLIRAAEIDAENIRRLATIAQAHETRLDDHEDRLDNLEGN